MSLEGGSRDWKWSDYNHKYKIIFEKFYFIFIFVCVFGWLCITIIDKLQTHP